MIENHKIIYSNKIIKFINLFLIIVFFSLDINRCSFVKGKIFENKLQSGKLDTSCFIKMNKLERFIYYEYHGASDYNTSYNQEEKTFTIKDLKGKRLKHHFLKHGDEILKVDECPTSLIFDREEDENDFVYLKYDYLAKYYYILFKRPSELIGKVEKVKLRRNGVEMIFDIKEYVAKNKDIDYDPFPEVREIIEMKGGIP